MSIVIVKAHRTAIGAFGGTLSPLSAVDFTTQLVDNMLQTVPLLKENIDEVILGQVLQSGCGQNPARQVAINTGLPESTPAYTVNKVCGSGMKSITLACQSIACGDSEIVLAGGMESMSQAPYIMDKNRWGAKFGNFEAKDAIISDGLWCAFNDYHMGITAENLADKYSFSREEQDAFAASSQQKVEKAQGKNRFKEEILPVTIKSRKKEIVFDQDEFPRAGTTAEGLNKLRPAFKPDGTVTAGNASGINDGAAVLLLMTREKAEKLGLEILAEVASYASAGVDPAHMGVGPVPATKKALKKANMTLEEIELFEFNEAFAVQSLAVLKELDVDPDKVNVNGGAISLGHPIGASGARIVVTLIHEMIKRKAKTGLASLCIGGGQGIALVLKR